MQQKNLENDIRLINDQIQALNVSNGMPNIRNITGIFMACNSL
jgi:hypothetical protein